MRKVNPDLTLLRVALLTVTIVLGCGIFVLPTFVAHNCVSAAQFLAVWAMGGFLSFAGILTYAQLASTHPQNGGDAIYLREEIHPSVGRLFLWAECFIIRPGCICILATAAAGHLLAAFPNQSVITSWQISSLIIFVCTISQFFPQNWNLRLVSLLAILKIAALAFGLFIIFISFGRFQVHPIVAPADGGNWAVGLALVLFTYGGWAELSYLTGEMKAGAKTFLLGVLLGLLVVTLLYLQIAYSLVTFFGLSGLANTQAPIGVMTGQILGPGYARALSGLISLCCIGAAHGICVSGSRLYRLLIPIKILPEISIPSAAVIFQIITSLGVFLLTGGVEEALLYTTPVVWCFAALSSAASLKTLRRGDGQKTKWLMGTSSVIFLGVSLFLVFRSVQYNPGAAMRAFVILLLGMPFAYLSVRKREELEIPAMNERPSEI